MSFADDLVSGVAQILEDASVGTWRPSGNYSESDDRPIYVQEAPSNRHRVLVVAHYPVTQWAGTNDTVEGIQVRNRGLPGDTRPANDDADAIRAALDGLTHVDLGGRHVSLIAWRSGTPLAQDANRRWEIVQNFHLFTARPNAHRED